MEDVEAIFYEGVSDAVRLWQIINMLVNEDTDGLLLGEEISTHWLKLSSLPLFSSGNVLIESS